nr:hypothetical protein [Tanacetum cinerariifolium]
MCVLEVEGGLQSIEIDQVGQGARWRKGCSKRWYCSYGSSGGIEWRWHLYCGDGGGRNKTILHMLCILDSFLDILGEGVKMVEFFLDLFSSHECVCDSGLELLGGRSFKEVKIFWIEVGGGIIRAKVVSMVALVRLKVVLMKLRGCEVELVLEAMVFKEWDKRMVVSRMGNTSMLKETGKEHSIRKSHVSTFGYTYHSIGNVVCKVEWFTNSETIEHIAKAGINVVFVPNEAYDIFTKDDLPLHKIGLQFGEDHLEGIESDVYSFDLTSLAERPFESVHTNSLKRNAKNSGEFLKTKSDFNIINDEGDQDGSIHITNEMDTFLKLKDEHGANLLVHVEKTIESNGCESRAKVRLSSRYERSMTRPSWKRGRSRDL